MLFQILGKKDILAVLHAGQPEAESASLGTKQKKALGTSISMAEAGFLQGYKFFPGNFCPLSSLKILFPRRNIKTPFCVFFGFFYVLFP